MVLAINVFTSQSFSCAQPFGCHVRHRTIVLVVECFSLDGSTAEELDFLHILCKAFSSPSYSFWQEGNFQTFDVGLVNGVGFQVQQQGGVQ